MLQNRNSGRSCHSKQQPGNDTSHCLEDRGVRINTQQPAITALHFHDPPPSCFPSKPSGKQEGARSLSMARIKQTARRSTRGKGPCKKLATKSMAQCGRCQKVITPPLCKHQTCSLCNSAGCEDCLHCVLCDWCWEAAGCTNCRQATRFALDEYTDAYLCHPCANSEVAESYYRTMHNNNRASSNPISDSDESRG